MAYTELLEATKDLSDSDIAEVTEFINFIKYKKNSGKAAFNGLKDGLKHKTDGSDNDESDNRVITNLMKGEKFYMADDFDETPDCFREYM